MGAVSMREVCVVGAGVVGVTTAWYLAEAGWKVRLLDRAGRVATGTSFLNGGQLSYRYVSPLADAGVPFKALKWLIESDGPLRFRPTADWSQWQWLGRFLMRCRGRANREMTERLARLGEYSRVRMNALLAEQQLPGIAWKQAGKLVVYRSATAFDRARRAVQAGGPKRALSGNECLAVEPALGPLAAQLHGGLLTEDEAVADCHAFSVALHEHLLRHPNFRGLLDDEAQGFERSRDGRLQLRTRHDLHGADAFVLAAGIGSRPLAASVGLALPLYPLKGYSLDAPIGPQHCAPRVSVTDFERKVLYARIGERLRVAAMVDLVGHDMAIDPRRIASLQRIARRDMPLAGDYDQARTWAGLRPATPDGAPILGPSPVPGLWFNLGHGALGFTFACGSASLLATMMNGGRCPLPLDGFAWRGR